ncbi:AraC family transcriptional regulator [Pedobacter sp. UBA4863]|uniref:AraC family transcriptional regulator n=1 Tax=Pedobacter sp. UBA4863 TaxID=1947060 RepID=UPI0025CD8FDF|nr:AraC family transcriptional regulator [Pedobacter sp. UBA4863]
MNTKLNLVPLSNQKNLSTLVENRSSFTLEKCELNIFETYQEAYQVPLTFNDFVIASMLRGKKVMHLDKVREFDYLPGESVIVPALETMRIDFPDASDATPTQCIALAIDQVQIKQTINYLNEYFPKESNNDLWELSYDEYHFYNNEEIAALINKLIKVCADTSSAKDVLADLTLKELLVRIIQTQNLMVMQGGNFNNNPLAYVIGYIKSNLGEKISVDSLSEKACMSKATFYRLFRKELGVSPNDFILAEKIKKAKELLMHPDTKISAISYELGFSDANYFIRAFKKVVGTTPGNYQLNALHL